MVDYGRVSKKATALLDYGRISKKDVRITKKGVGLVDYGRDSDKPDELVDNGKTSKDNDDIVDNEEVIRKDQKVENGLSPWISAPEYAASIDNNRYRQRVSRLKLMLKQFDDASDKGYPNFLFTRRGRSPWPWLVERLSQDFVSQNKREVCNRLKENVNQLNYLLCQINHHHIAFEPLTKTRI